MENGFDSPPPHDATAGSSVLLFRYDNPTVPNGHPNSDTSRDELVGRWFTDSPESLKSYIKMRPPGGSIVIVEIPGERLEGLRATLHPVAKDMDIEPDNFIIPDELLGNAKRVPLGVTSKSQRNFSRVDEWKSVDNRVDEIVKEIQSSKTINDKLRATLKPLQDVIRESQIPDYDGSMHLNERYHDVESSPSGVGVFSFWGSIEESGFSPDLPAEPTAVVKNIRILEVHRKRGLGTKFIKTWERVLSEKGIRVFTATNIRDENAKHFWEKLGYHPLPGETRTIPYSMYKTVSPATLAQPLV